MDSSRIRSIWRGLEPRGQITIVGAGLLVVIVLYLLYSYASHPSFVTLSSGVDPSQTSQITRALDGAGIAYRVANGGTEVDVQDGTLSAARVALAEKGVSNGGQVGFEIFDKQGLGTTDFQQKVDYQRALEGEIARAIEQIDGVSSADVQLVLPDDSLFVDQSPKATAAVLLTTGGQLDSSTVSGIAHLVASSVKGLGSQDVTITDQTGALLWPSASAAGGANAGSKLAADQLYSAQLAASINSMLASTLGADKAQARVQADLNVDQTTIDTVTYAKKGTPLQDQTQQETLKSQNGGASTSLPAGTKTNTSTTPTYPSGGTGNGNSDYKSQSSNTTYGVDKTVQHTQVAPGTVRRVDVALLVDKSVPAATVAALKTSVASVAGIDAKRGDTLAVSRVSFAKPTVATAKKAGPMAALGSPAALAKWVLAIIAAAIFLFMMRRTLKKRETEGSTPEPTWLREITAGATVAELESGGIVRPALAAGSNRSAALKNQAEEIARQQPEQLAAQVGQWLKE